MALTGRKLNPRELRLLALTALVLAIAVVARLRSTSGSEAAPARAAESKVEELPRIDLARLDAPPREAKAGRRDIFEFGAPPERESAAAAPAKPDPPAVPAAELEPTPAPVPTLPPLNLKYIGSLDNSRGIKVAVLMTEKNEILTGKVGEVVANRYKIEKIGFESVDLKDVTSGQTRRIALRAK